ncbi:MAG: S24 family peptidase [Burkholderiales bacterium]|jgi:phage repressor protein C with HTH and peptisase S24 domain|nr:S24 family peptidase [Burkholderiales bacterium]
MKTSKEIRLDNLFLAIARKGSIDTLAKNAETSPSYISQLKNGVIEQKTGKTKGVGDDVARKIERALGEPTGWMDADHSRDASPGTARARPILTYASLDELPMESTVLIPSARPTLSAGSGEKPSSAAEEIPLPFQTDGLRQLKSEPKHLLAVKVTDRSMEPLLFSGDTVVIDRSETRVPVAGGVFAVAYGDEMLVKRLFKLPDGLRVQSDNPSEGLTFELPGDRADAVQVIGRVKYRSGAGDF